MVINNRQSEIIEILKKQKRISVKKLAAQLFVSEMTIRRDLDKLEKMGYLQRYNGGAVYSYDYQLPIQSRKLLHSKEKKYLSNQTKKYLDNSMSVYIDSSSTCLYTVPILSTYKDITIITNSVQCLLAASNYHIKCIIAGGTYYEHDMCMIGSNTNEFLRGINVDIGFFSSLGLDDDGIISDSDELQTSVRKAIIPNCKKRIFLFDSTKLHKKYIYTLCTADDVDEIIII